MGICKNDWLVQRNVFTGAHPLRSLTSAARPVLAVLRHIRSTARSLTPVQRITLAAVWGNEGLCGVFGVFVSGMTDQVNPFTGCQLFSLRL
jgi:hypothetical protein